MVRSTEGFVPGLDGSFSGAWVCELCGGTGSACGCEHFKRQGWSSMTYAEAKRLGDAEMAAEMWVAVGKRCEAFWLFGEHRAWRDDPQTEKLCEIEVIMGRFAMAEHAAVNGYV